MGKVAQEVGISKTILLIDDEDAFRTFVRVRLEHHGYAVLEARNADEAMQVCQETAGPISLLLTDLVLPEVSGRALADRLITIHPEMKVLYMSAYGDYAIGVKGALEPDANYLPKPFTAETLNGAICEVLR